MDPPGIHCLKVLIFRRDLFRFPKESLTLNFVSDQFMVPAAAERIACLWVAGFD
jgi:hypothetical protein